jgi:hypothetical protein
VHVKEEGEVTMADVNDDGNEGAPVEGSSETGDDAPADGDAPADDGQNDSEGSGSRGRGRGRGRGRWGWRGRGSRGRSASAGVATLVTAVAAPSRGRGRGRGRGRWANHWKVVAARQQAEEAERKQKQRLPRGPVSLVRVKPDVLQASQQLAYTLNGVSPGEVATGFTHPSNPDRVWMWAVVSARTSSGFECVLGADVKLHVSPVEVEIAVARTIAVSRWAMECASRPPETDIESTWIHDSVMKMSPSQQEKFRELFKALIGDRTLVLSDRTCLSHCNPKRHPENAERLVAVLRHLATKISTSPTALPLHIGQYYGVTGLGSVGRSQFPAAAWSHMYSSCAVQGSAGSWSFLPSLPSWACLRLAHDESYLLRLLSMASQSAQLHRESAAATGKLSQASAKALRRVHQQTYTAGEPQGSSDSSDDEATALALIDEMGVAVEYNTIAVPHTTLQHKEILAIPLDVDTSSSDDEKDSKRSKDKSAAHHSHVHPFWEAPQVAVFAQPDRVESNLSVVDIPAQENPAVAARVTSAVAAVKDAPLTERAVYSRVGLHFGQDVIPVGDTFLTFKSFLVATTAAGVVCEVRW